MLDEHTGCSLVRFTYRENDEADPVIEMVRELNKIFESKALIFFSIKRNLVKWIWSDGGREYIGSMVQNRLKQRGIVHEVSTP